LTEPDWIQWARRLAAIAQNGLEFSSDPYDQRRYAEVREIAAAMLAAGSGTAPEVVIPLLAWDRGYTTPKIAVRGACFDGRDSERVLLVRERDDGLWTLPGGWADTSDLPSTAIEREVEEEAGYRVRATRLLACWDRVLQEGAPPYPWRVYALFFACEILGEGHRADDEISDVGWFPITDLPPLSVGRITAAQITHLATLHRNPYAPAAFH
jgi:ADP-ribose pyrophosphatase YjhB (NUDIX family)